MRLIAILISLWADRYPQYLDSWRRPQSLFGYADWLRRKVLPHPHWQGMAGALAFLAPPILLLALVQAWLDNWLLGLVLGVLALLFAHGPGRVDDDLEAFIEAWEQEDLGGCRRSITALSGEPESPAALEELPELAVRGLFWQTYERLLAPFFWFVLLGPVGAVAVRLAYIGRDYARYREEQGQAFDAALSQLLFVLNWIPVRLAALTFGLAGSFVDAMQGWRDALVSATGGNRELLEEAACGALDRSPEDLEPAAVVASLREARALVTRCVLFWLALIALLTITGWLA